ncbi:MAG TPA: hypothetical protein VF516_04525 [Kofleriaceae bacterium]
MRLAITPSSLIPHTSVIGDPDRVEELQHLARRRRAAGERRAHPIEPDPGAERGKDRLGRRALVEQLGRHRLAALLHRHHGARDLQRPEHRAAALLVGVLADPRISTLPRGAVAHRASGTAPGMPRSTAAGPDADQGGCSGSGAARTSKRRINSARYARSSAGGTPAGSSMPSRILISDRRHASVAGRTAAVLGQRCRQRRLDRATGALQEHDVDQIALLCPADDRGELVRAGRLGAPFDASTPVHAITARRRQPGTRETAWTAL